MADQEGAKLQCMPSNEVGKDDQKIIFAFKACFSGHASPAGDTSSCEHALQDSDWMGGETAASRDSDLYLSPLAE